MALPNLTIELGFLLAFTTHPGLLEAIKHLRSAHAPQVPRHSISSLRSQAMRLAFFGARGLHEGRDGRGLKPKEEDMRVLISILRLRFSRKLISLRWIVAVCRGPPG
jgi:hypothetical protein